VKRILFIASAVAFAAMAYIGKHLTDPVPKPAAPPAPARASSAGVAWLPIAVVVVLVLAGVVAAVAWRRRAAIPPVPDREQVDSRSVQRWHVILKAATPHGVVELRRGPIDYPATSHTDVAAEVVARWIAVYGVPDPSVRLFARATPAL
jgi:hypothetical protein